MTIGIFPFAGGPAHGGHKFRKTVVHEDGVDIRNQRGRVFRQSAAKVNATASGDGFFARRIEQNK